MKKKIFWTVVFLSLLCLLAIVFFRFREADNSIGELKVSGEPCQTDNDCRISCRYGAVTKKWYDDNSNFLKNDKEKGECLGGCEETSVAKCQEKKCVAVFYNVPDKINYDCTNGSKPSDYK